MFQIATADGAGINLDTGAKNYDPTEDKAYTPITRAGAVATGQPRFITAC